MNWFKKQWSKVTDWWNSLRQPVEAPTEEAKETKSVLERTMEWEYAHGKLVDGEITPAFLLYDQTRRLHRNAEHSDSPRRVAVLNRYESIINTTHQSMNEIVDIAKGFAEEQPTEEALGKLNDAIETYNRALVHLTKFSDDYKISEILGDPKDNKRDNTLQKLEELLIKGDPTVIKGKSVTFVPEGAKGDMYEDLCPTCNWPQEPNSIEFNENVKCEDPFHINETEEAINSLLKFNPFDAVQDKVDFDNWERQMREDVESADNPIETAKELEEFWKSKRPHKNKGVRRPDQVEEAKPVDSAGESDETES